MSTIDELQRLHEAATTGEWMAKTEWPDTAAPVIETPDAWVVETSCSGMEGGGFLRAEDALAVVSKHNAWPAIHRVLVAARACDGGALRELRELVDAVKALDGGA